MRHILEGATVASVHPLPLFRQERPFGPPNMGGMTSYEMDACPKGSPPQIIRTRMPHPDGKGQLLELRQIVDGFQKNITLSFDMISYERICQDIVTDHWRAGFLGVPDGLGPGVWICAGPEPSAQEIEENLERETGYCEWLYQTGQALAAKSATDPKAWTDILIHHRAAAEWIGRGDEPWVRKRRTEDIQSCPWCFKPVDPRAYVCGSCSRQFREAPAELQRFLVGAVSPEAQDTPPRRSPGVPFPPKAPIDPNAPRLHTP